MSCPNDLSDYLGLFVASGLPSIFLPFPSVPKALAFPDMGAVTHYTVPLCVPGLDFLTGGSRERRGLMMSPAHGRMEDDVSRAARQRQKPLIALFLLGGKCSD